MHETHDDNLEYLWKCVGHKCWNQYLEMQTCPYLNGLCSTSLVWMKEPVNCVQNVMGRGS